MKKELNEIYSIVPLMYIEDLHKVPPLPRTDIPKNIPNTGQEASLAGMSTGVEMKEDKIKYERGFAQGEYLGPKTEEC